MVHIANNLDIIKICWLILFLYWLVSAFFTKKSATKQTVGGTILWRIVLLIVVILFFKFDRTVATAFFSFLLFRSFWSHPIVGAILAVTGLIIALSARIFLGRNWSSYVTYKKEHELVTAGPYRLIRHPIYSGILLMLIGTFVYYSNLIILVILALAAIMIAWRMGREEKIMADLFGEKYTDYMKKSKRLIPWIY